MNDDARDRRAEDRLADLLLEWEERTEQGEAVDLEELCSEAPELVKPLTRQIRALSRANAMIGTLGGSTLVNRGPGSPSGLDLDLDRLVQTTVSLRLDRVHASGGKGHVVEAFDERLRRSVAVKFVAAKVGADSIDGVRLIREAEITGRLDHPGIVPIHSVGEDDLGRPFYCMRFLSGATLREAIQRMHGSSSQNDHRPDHRQLRDLLGRFVSVCQTIAFAHSRQVIHRDLKPDNIVLGSYGETYVIDWGLAKDLSQSGEQDGEPSGGHPQAKSQDSSDDPAGSVTRTDAILGTPSYMSPEQARGETADVRYASDLFSLGATLYAILTGQPPYADRNVVQVIERAERADYPRLTRRQAAGSRGLAAICHRALQLRPEDRYPDAESIARDVQNWLADEPVAAHPESFMERAARWGRRHRRVVATASVGVVMAAALLMATLLLVTSERQRTRAANAEAAARRAEAETSFRTVDEFFSIVHQDDGLLETELSPLQEEIFRASLAFYQFFAEQHRDDPKLQDKVAASLRRVAISILKIGDVEDAFAPAQESLALYEGLLADQPGHPEYRFSVALARDLLAVLFMEVGDFRESRRQLDLSLAIKDELSGQPHGAVPLLRSIATSLSNRGVNSLRLGDAEAAAPDLLQALELCRELRAENPEDESFQLLECEVGLNAGLALFESGKMDQAAAVIEAAQQLAESHRARRPEWDRAMFFAALGRIRLAQIEERRRHPAEATELFSQALDLMRELVRRDPAIQQYRFVQAVCLRGIASQLADHEREASIAACEESRQLLVSLLAESPTSLEFQLDLGYALLILGDLLRDQGDNNGSITRFVECCHVFEQILATHPELPDPPRHLALVEEALGDVFYLEGEYDQAAQAQGSALAYWLEQRDLNPDVVETDLEVIDLRARLGLSQYMSGRFAEAESSLQEFVESVDRIPEGVDLAFDRNRDDHLARSIHALAMCHFQLAQYDRCAEVSIKRGKLWPHDPVELYEAGCALALCADALQASDPVAGGRFRDQSLEFLNRSLDAGHRDLAAMRDDVRLRNVIHDPSIWRRIKPER